SVVFLAEYSAKIKGNTELGTRTVDVIHHLGHTFNSPKGGNTSSFLTGNTWNVWYVNLLGNIVLLEQDAAAAGPTSNNVQAVAKILKAHLFYELTSIWEEIPFTQALDGVTFPTPEFDDQETVLDGVVTLIDEALALIDSMPAEGNFNFSQGDILLGGDITRWREFAVTVKVRSLMLIRNVSARESDAESQLAAINFDEAVSAPVFLQYEGGSGADNGYFDLVNAFFGPSNEAVQIYGPSEAMRDQLINTNDPRRDLWLVDLSGTGNYPVADYGVFPSPTETVYSDNLIRGSYPDVYALPGEIDFVKAELALDGVIGGSPQEFFEDGIANTINYWGGGIDGFAGTAVTDGQIDAFITGLGPVTQQKIHEQQWLETFFRPVVAWNTVRRTGVPDLDPPGNAIISTILKRFNYPPDEVGANPNTPPNLETDTPMWFEDL
ncbi:MAG: SusD/RagB family nutrient-binding outer membrane lipoprotein, partial [Bacteroidota bacterium]